MEFMSEFEQLLAINGIKMAPPTDTDVGGEGVLDNIDEAELRELTEFLSEAMGASNVDGDNSIQSDEIVNYTTLDAMPVPTMEVGNEVTYSSVLPIDDQTTYSVLPIDDQTTYSSILPSNDLTTYNVVQNEDQSYTMLVPIPSTVEQSPSFVAFNDEENVEQMNTVSPSEVFGGAPKKRGRKRKSEDGSAPVPRRRRPKKVKVYEIETPFEDEERERKRKNAMNAKRHRDMQKKTMEDLRKQLDSVNAEKKSLQQEVEQLRQRETALVQQLQLYQQQGNVLCNVLIV